MAGPKIGVDPDQSCIFVVGAARSGTTLLRLMLNAHPRIYLTHEASFYLHARFVPKSCDVSQWLNSYFQSFPFEWLQIDHGKILTELSGYASRIEFADAFRAVMKCKAREYRKPRYGDKTPFHIMFLGKIFEDFQDPRVIHIVRDPRAVTASLNRMPWASGSKLLNSLYYIHQLNEAKPFRERILEVRYEDLVSSTESVMRTILSFVDEDWNDAVLNHSRAPRADDLPPYPWLAGATGRCRKPDQFWNWREAMPLVWIRIVERITQEAMNRYGYQQYAPDGKTSIATQFAACIREVPELLAFSARFLKIVRRSRCTPPPDAKESANMFLSLNPHAWRHYPEFKEQQEQINV